MRLKENAEDSLAIEQIPGLDSIVEPVAAELRLVRNRVLDAIPTKPKLTKISPAAKHMLGKHGKYLRPALVLLSCGLCGESPECAVDYAAVMEILHIGSLVLDDLLDGSELRRGRKTVNARWGNQIALLTGTHLLLEMTNRMAFESRHVREVLIDTLNSMFVGEVMQFEAQKNFNLEEKAYMEIITGKSASAMSACCRVGALAAGREDTEETMGEFGMELGTAFQIRDDLLDLIADPGKLGKELGSDLRDARMTLPLIHCARNSSKSDLRYLKGVFGSNNGRKVDVNRVNSLVKNTGSIDYCMKKARSLADKAVTRLDAFEESRYRGALEALCRFAVEREY